MNEEDIKNLIQEHYNIAEHYYNEKDYDKALDWFTRSAGYKNQYAQFRLGLMYGTAQGVKLDHKAALDWFILSYDQGNKIASWQLGKIYEYGLGVNIDPVKAIEYYKISYERGFTHSYINLSELMDNDEFNKYVEERERQRQ